MWHKKEARLKEILSSFRSVLVAFSGGVDSTYLLSIAQEVLKNKVLAVIASSETYPQHELLEAKKIAEQLKARYLVIQTQELSNPKFAANPKERCYYCKLELFTQLKKIAGAQDLNYVIDGSNLDDLKDFRPGSKAKKELEIFSPLQEASFTKAEIREASQARNLKTWNKPAYACLASRLPYGTKIEPEILQKIDAAENFIRSLGFSQVRVRHHGNLARIEVVKEEIPRMLGSPIAGAVEKKLQELGYNFVSIDLSGYRTGSLNEVLVQEGF